MTLRQGNHLKKELVKCHTVDKKLKKIKKASKSLTKYLLSPPLMHNLPTHLCGQINSPMLELLPLNYQKEDLNKPHGC